MSIATVHLGDVGTLLRVTITENGTAVDISAATTKQIKFQKKNRETFVRDASFYTDGSDGMITYTFQAGELDVKGVWTIQAYVELPNGKWHSTKEEFTVDPNIVIVAP